LLSLIGVAAAARIARSPGYAALAQDTATPRNARNTCWRATVRNRLNRASTARSASKGTARKAARAANTVATSRGFGASQRSTSSSFLKRATTFAPANLPLQRLAKKHGNCYTISDEPRCVVTSNGASTDCIASSEPASPNCLADSGPIVSNLRGPAWRNALARGRWLCGSDQIMWRKPAPRVPLSACGRAGSVTPKETRSQP
jgi:hypothetical protein